MRLGQEKTLTEQPQCELHWSHELGEWQIWENFQEHKDLKLENEFEI